MKVLLLSRYSELGASSRVRFFQYLPFLESEGLKIDVDPLFSDDYLQALYSSQSRKVIVFVAYCHRLWALMQARKYDFLWIEKEILPFMPAFLERLLSKIGVPYIVDYDDALFHRYDKHRNWIVRSFLGRKIDSVMKHAALVVAGNQYLADRASLAGAHRVEIVPTVVNIERYIFKNERINQKLVVGWIGSPSTSHYLRALKPVFDSLKEQFDVRFVAVGARPEDLINLPIETLPWSERTEVESLQSFDIGIMPLSDTPWERGKCGYKLIQYMACGLPVVASAVGANKKIINHGSNGFLVDKLDDWEMALGVLLKNQTKRKQMGQEGRTGVESWYSMQVQAPRLLSFIRSVIQTAPRP
jgi:glycosyltransferase involved in cell wall biosynthesis